jgi:hypothetical protein
MKARALLCCVLAASWALVAGCDNTRDVAGHVETKDEPTSFSTGDAATEPEAGLTSYCPSSNCPSGWTTCVASPFRCDVNLKTDRRNCGACGNACPAPSNSEIYECVDGHCVMQCTGQPLALDCDGMPDNGCEISGVNNDHCGACGNKCTDPAKPCVQYHIGGNEVGCGCKGDNLYCTQPWAQCVDPKIDDANCGACGNACSPTVDGEPDYPNMYYGCYSGECGHLKCTDGWANCDGNVTNGCETSISSPANCGGCGIACAPGQECGLELSTSSLQCMCPAGQTFCKAWCFGDTCMGECFDLSSDRDNCGACGLSCQSSPGMSSIGVCAYGMCNRQCLQGWADCNGNDADDCEVNTNSDPLNCGGCGHACDAVAGQACVGGKCVVEPCDHVEDAGVITR